MLHLRSSSRAWLVTLCSVLDDHSRVKLKTESNSTKEDYINASIIVSSLTATLVKVMVDTAVINILYL